MKKNNGSALLMPTGMIQSATKTFSRCYWKINTFIENQDFRVIHNHFLIPMGLFLEHPFHVSRADYCKHDKYAQPLKSTCQKYVNKVTSTILLSFVYVKVFQYVIMFVFFIGEWEWEWIFYLYTRLLFSEI